MPECQNKNRSKNYLLIDTRDNQISIVEERDVTHLSVIDRLRNRANLIFRELRGSIRQTDPSGIYYDNSLYLGASEMPSKSLLVKTNDYFHFR